MKYNYLILQERESGRLHINIFMKGKKTDWKVYWKNKKIEKKKNTKRVGMILITWSGSNEWVNPGWLTFTCYLLLD